MKKADCASSCYQCQAHIYNCVSFNDPFVLSFICFSSTVQAVTRHWGGKKQGEPRAQALPWPAHDLADPFWEKWPSIGEEGSQEGRGRERRSPRTFHRLFWSSQRRGRGRMLPAGPCPGYWLPGGLRLHLAPPCSPSPGHT